MYHVKYNGNYVTSDPNQYPMTAIQAENKGLHIEFRTKREAEKVRNARAKLTHLRPDQYQIVPIHTKATSPEEDKVSTEEIAEKLLSAVTAEYKDDRPMPGLVISKLLDGRIYASVARYNQKQQFYPFNTQDKVIIAKATNKTVRGALIELSQTWLQDGVARNALVNALKGA